jgi:hypothetical protein
MTRSLAVPALVAACLLAACNKTQPETGAAPAQEPAAAGYKASNDSSTMAVDSTAMQADSTTMTTDTSSMPADTTAPATPEAPADTSMAMPADSTQQ